MEAIIFKNCVMGMVKVVETVEYQEFDEDNGWEDMAVLPGNYPYRIGYIKGWKPVQLFIDGVWVDAPFEIIEYIVK